MKLKNIKEVEEFRKVIHACAGDVYLKSQDGDVFNLKSALSEYIALGQLLSEQGDNLELFADRREDEARLINFLAAAFRHSAAAAPNGATAVLFMKRSDGAQPRNPAKRSRG